MLWLIGAIAIAIVWLLIARVITIQRRIHAAEQSEQSALWDRFMGLLALALVRDWTGRKRSKLPA
jgi:hypothetical protein